MTSESKGDPDDGEYEYDRFTVGNLSEIPGPLEKIDASVPVKEAMTKMLEKQYSQLPVLEKHTCIGSITLESILHVVLNEALKGQLDSRFLTWPVKRFVDSKTKYADPEDDLLEHAEIMAEQSFVLVGNPNNVEGILTNYDLVHFLKRKTESFLLLREIETSLRYIIHKKLGSQSLEEALQSMKTEDGSKCRKLEELTVNDLRQVVNQNWLALEDTFVDQEKTDAQLQKVRRLRNQILHFRSHLIASNLYDLRILRNRFAKIAKQISGCTASPSAWHK